jgi:DNA recombination protein Rad52
MPFTDAQNRLLAGKLSANAVKTRKQDGRVVSYIEGWHAIAEANRIFGFDGWDRETIDAQCIWQDAKRDAKACAYVARVRIRVRAGNWLVSRDGSGSGHGSAPTLGEAHESALKEAETDATKRALATFGNLFGLALYDREQNGVRKRNGNGTAVGVFWAVLSATGGLVSRHALPEEFCRALRDLMERTPTLDRLNAIWARNAATITHLRRAWPDLKTVNGTHYGDVLDKLFEQRAERLAQDTAANANEEASGAIDKSELALSVARRHRDPAHRLFVAKLPCLICGRAPSQAHHLRFAQPRALGMKVSDEWTVPLCGSHHRALHEFGVEEKWWQQMGIAPLAEAEKLWQQSHAPVPLADVRPLHSSGGATEAADPVTQTETAAADAD